MTLSDGGLTGTAGPVAPWGSVGRVFIVGVELSPLTAWIPLVLGRAPEPVAVAAQVTGALVTVGAEVTGTPDGIGLGLVTWMITLWKGWPRRLWSNRDSIPDRGGGQLPDRVH